MFDTSARLSFEQLTSGDRAPSRTVICPLRAWVLFYRRHLPPQIKSPQQSIPSREVIQLLRDVCIRIGPVPCLNRCLTAKMLMRPDMVVPSRELTERDIQFMDVARLPLIQLASASFCAPHAGQKQPSFGRFCSVFYELNRRSRIFKLAV